MSTFVFAVPFLPAGPNSSGDGAKRKGGTHSMNHWELTSLKAQWRKIVRAALPAEFPQFGRGPVHVGVVRCAVGMMDRDNAVASMKYVIDGLVHAGVIDDDNQDVVYGVDVVQHKVHKNDQTGIVLFIEEVPPVAKRDLFVVQYANEMLQDSLPPIVTEYNMYSLYSALRKG